MSEYRKQIGVAVMIALVGAFSLAIIANYSFPTQPGEVSTTSQTSSTALAIPSAVSTTTSQSQSLSTGNVASVTSPGTTSAENGTIVLPPAGNGVNFTEAGSVALSSPSVEAYWNNNVNNTFQGYAVGPVVQGQNGSWLVSVTFSVTDSRAISGNWTSEYSLTYSQRFNINVTVEFTPPSAYQVINVGIQDLPNFSQSISFTGQQMQIIQVALSNSTVKQYTAQSEYYVQSVTFFPSSGNQTFAGDYLVYIGQVNGSCVIGIFVNPTTNSVVTTYGDTRMGCS